MINRLIKELPRALVIAVLIFFVLLIIRLISGVSIQLNKNLAANFGYTMLYGLTLYFANAYLFMFLDDKFEVDRFSKKRITIGFLGSFIISVFIIFLLRIFEDVVIENKTFEAFLLLKLLQII